LGFWIKFAGEGAAKLFVKLLFCHDCEVPLDTVPEDLWLKAFY